MPVNDPMVTDILSRGLSHTAALEHIVSFTERFGENHFLLACHAAFPLAITPDLLYQVWATFVPQAPWTSVCDVLLSNLCHEVGFELYEMDLTIRNLLLREIENDQRLGKQRLGELADFLFVQVAHQRHITEDYELSRLSQLQQWTALAYTKPNKAAYELALELSRTSENFSEDLFRLASFTETLAEPLRDFAPLLTYASAVSNLMRGNVISAQSQFDSIAANNDQILISGVELPIPNLGYRKKEIKVESSTYTNIASNYNPDFFVDREKETGYFTDLTNRLARGNPFGPEERVIHFVGPSGIGKSYLLKKCYAVTSNMPESVPVLIKLEMFGRKNENLVEAFLAAVDKEFCNYLGILTKKKKKSLQQFSLDISRKIVNTKHKVFILFLDELDLLRKEEINSIEEYFLDGLVHNNNRAMLVTAGRTPAMLNDFSLRPSSRNLFVLPPFDMQATAEQLEKLKPGSSYLAGKIQELGGGIPGNNTKLVEHMVGDPPVVPNELMAVQSILADVKSDIEMRFHPIVEAICILPDFNPDDVASLFEIHPALHGEWDESRIRGTFTDLKKVQVGPGSLIGWSRDKKDWVMDESTRTLFERELKLRDPGLWRKLHCTAYRMYQSWGEEYNSQVYRDKALYHQQCLKSAGMDCDG